MTFISTCDTIYLDINCMFSEWGLYSEMEDQISATIKDKVYKTIKKDICSGVYSPGQWLQEKELTENLGVSRSPIREALRMLVSDGIVVEIPNKGVFVREFTVRDIQEIFDMRLMMESYAIGRCAKRFSDDQREKLESIIKDMEKSHREKDLAAYIDCDTKLHNTIIEMSGNKLLADCYRRVRTMTQRFRIYSLNNTQRFDESVSEHAQIVQYILSGNTGRAQMINSRHLELARDKILEYIEAKQK